MTADSIFVAQNEQLQQLQPPIEDKVRLRLQRWSVQQLRTWLGLRGVRSGDSLKEDLVRIAFFTWKLALPVNPDEVATQKEAAKRLNDLLTTDVMTLPDPTTVTDWIDDLRELPTVTYADIYNYLIHSPGICAVQLKAYKSLESYNYAVNGWVQELLIHKPSPDFAFIKARVRPSQHSTAPYDAWVMVRQDGRVEAGRCCCTAGLGEVCSHVGAILFKMMGAAELGLNDPDSCTSKACEWNKAFCKQVMPATLDCIDFKKPRINQTRKRSPPTRKCSRSSSSSSSDGELWDIMAEAAPNAVVLHILSPPCPQFVMPAVDDVFSEVTVFDNDPTPTLPAEVMISHIVKTSKGPSALFLDISSSVSPEQSQLIYDATKGQSSNSLWHQIRQDRITASKMGEVMQFMNSSRRVPSASLMNDIIGPPKNLDHIPAIKWGRENEDTARREYLEKTSDQHALLTIQRCGVKIPSGDAQLGASADGYITCDCCEDRVLEIKCPYTAACLGLTPEEGLQHGCIPFLDENGLLKQNHKFYTQVQAQMAFLDAKLCEFVVWTPYGITVESIPFNGTFWQTTKAGLDKFYVSYVIPSLTGGTIDLSISRSSSNKAHHNRAHSPDSAAPVKKRKRGPKYPCTVCAKNAASSSVGCDNCQEWTHFKCVGLNGTEDFLLTMDWFCKNCK